MSLSYICQVLPCVWLAPKCVNTPSETPLEKSDVSVFCCQWVSVTDSLEAGGLCRLPPLGLNLCRCCTCNCGLCEVSSHASPWFLNIRSGPSPHCLAPALACQRQVWDSSTAGGYAWVGTWWWALFCRDSSWLPSDVVEGGWERTGKKYVM